MEKQDTYDVLHKELAEKYKTDYRLIGALRGLAIQHKTDRKGTIYFFELKIKTKKSVNKLEKYNGALAFLKSITDEAFADIAGPKN